MKLSLFDPRTSKTASFNKIYFKVEFANIRCYNAELLWCCVVLAHIQLTGQRFSSIARIIIPLNLTNNCIILLNTDI